MTQYIADTDHYTKVIAQIPKVKRLLWIDSDSRFEGFVLREEG